MSNIFGMGQAANLLAAGGFWDVVVNALSGVLIWVGDLLVSLIFVVFKFVLNIVDLLQILVERLVGIDFWGQPGASIETFQDSDIIFKFLMSDAVQSAFRTMVVVSIVLLIVFTIIAIIKSEYDVAATGDTKKHSSKMPIFQTAMKSLLTVVLIPILLIMGILASNAILTSLVNALNVNNDLTLGSQVFSVSAYSANRYRVYAATGQRYAAVTEVNYIYEDAADASLNGTFSINPFLTSIMPTSYTAENPFEGFLFKGSDGKEYLFLITSKDADLSNYPAREGLSSWEYKVKVYQKYLADKNLADASSFVDIPSGLGNLNTLKSDHRYIKAAYNTWTYNNRFAESESFEIATDMSNKSAFLAVNGTEAQVTYPQNSEHWGTWVDGGVKQHSGNVVNGWDEVLSYDYAPIADEYYVMADIVDFMASNNVSLNFVNIADPRINWNYYGTDSGMYNYIGTSTPVSQGANGWDEGAIDRLRVDYKNAGRIGYEANLEASDEADGAIYVMCFYAQNKFVPILHGVDMGIKSNVVAFRSNYLESSYRGLVVGRGMIASADENNYGYPSVIASTYDSGKSNDGIDLDEAFYVHTTTSGKRYGAFVLEHDYGVTFNSDFAEKITADDDPNKGFYQLKKHNALLGVKGDAVSGYDCDASGNVTRLSNAAKERILKALPTSFTISLYEGTKFDENGLLLEENKVKEKTEYSILSFGEQSPPYLFWDKGGITISGSEMTIKLKQARTVGSSEDYAGMKIAVCVDLNALLEDGKLSYYFTCSNTYNEPFVMFVDESAEECLARMGQHLIENNKTQYETNNGRFGVVEGVVVDTHSSGKIYADTTDGVRIDDVSWQATSDFVTATSIVSNAKDATLQLNYASIVGKIERDDTELTGFSVGDGVSVLLEDENKIKFQIKDRGTNRNPVLSVEIDESGLLHYGISDFFEYREYVRKSEPAANGNYYVESTFAIEGLSSDNFNKYKDLGTVETLGGGNNHVWTVNVDYDKKMLWGNVVFQENLGESGFWGLRYDEDIEHLEHFLDSVHEDYEKHRIYVDGDGVLVKAYALVDFDLSTFNALSFLGVKGDGSSKVYTYDPDNDGSYAFYNKNGLFSTSFGEAGSDSVLQNKFGEIYEQSFTLSPEYIKFEDSFHVDRVEIENDAVLESGIYDKFNVTFSIFDRPWKDEDANHIVKVTSYYYIKVENSDSEQAVCPGVISADMLIELVRNDDKFVINSGTFTNLPVYSAEEAGELFSGKYSKKVSFVTTKVDKGFLGIKIDFKLWDSLLDFGGFRFHAETGTTNMPNQYVYHSYVDGKVAVNYSGLGIDFFGAEKSGYYSFNTFYVPHKFNFIVFVFAAIVIFNILFTSVWGLISRIYEIVVYFIVMPGVAAATTMDGGKMFKSWKDNLIKKVFASYGVILGLNLFFLLIPPLKEASQIFRDSDFVGMNMDWILWDYKAEFINQLIYLMFLLVAISMLKTLPATIAGLIGSGDVYKDGGDVKKNVKDTVDDVTTKIKDTVSGKALAGVVEKGFEYADSVKKNGFFMAPFKDKDGNWRGFVPGSAVYNEFKKHKKNKDEEKPDDATEQTEAPKEPTGVTPGGGTPEPLLDDNGNPIVTGAENGQDATGASETPTSALFDENGNPLGFEGESLAGDGTTTFNITDHPEFFDQAMQAVDGEFVDDNISKYFDLNEKLAEAEKSKAEAEANGNSDLVKFYQSRIDEINEEKISIAERYGAISENGMADDVAMSATRDRYNEFLESRALIVGRQAAADAERAVVDQINGEIETLESQREELAKRVQERDVSEQEKLALRIQMSQIDGEIIKKQAEKEQAEKRLQVRENAVSGQKKMASMSYLSYLTGSMTSTERRTAQGRVAELNKLIEEQQRAIEVQQQAVARREMLVNDDIAAYAEVQSKFAGQKLNLSGKNVDKMQLFADVFALERIQREFDLTNAEKRKGVDRSAVMQRAKELGLNDGEALKKLIETGGISESRTEQAIKKAGASDDYEEFKLARENAIIGMDYLAQEQARLAAMRAETVSMQTQKSAIELSLAADDAAKEDYMNARARAQGGAGAAGEQGTTGTEGAQGSTGETGAQGEDGETITEKYGDIRAELYEKAAKGERMTKTERELYQRFLDVDHVQQMHEKGKFEKAPKGMELAAIEEFNRKRVESGGELILDARDETVRRLAREAWNEKHADQKVLREGDEGFEAAAIEAYLKGHPELSRADLTAEQAQEAIEAYKKGNQTMEDSAVAAFIQAKTEEQAIAAWNADERHAGKKIHGNLSDSEKNARIQAAVAEYGKVQKAMQSEAGDELAESIRNENIEVLAAQVMAERVPDTRNKREKSMEEHTVKIDGLKQGLELLQSELEALRSAKHDDETTKRIADGLSFADVEKFRDAYEDQHGKGSFAKLSPSQKNAVLRASKEADLTGKIRDAEQNIRFEQAIVDYGRFDTRAVEAVRKALGNVDLMRQELAETADSASWDDAKVGEHVGRMTQREKAGYEKLIMAQIGSGKWAKLSPEEKNRLMIEQERVIKQKQIDAIENGIKSGGVTRVGGKKVKFTDATTANMIGIQTALVTAQKRQEASKRKAGIKENLQRIKRGRKVAETTESAEASTAATREKIKQYREIAATGTDKERKRAEREAIKAFEELRKKQDERSRALIASAQAKLERAKKAGDAEAQKAAEGIIARQTALIEKRAQASKSQSYLTSVKTHKPKSTSVKEETKKRAKATGERSRTSAASAAEKGMGARHGSIEQAFKGEVEGLIKKHLTSDEIKKALGSSKKTVRLSAQEVRELAEVVKGKLEEKITGISGGRSTRSLEASEKELLKKLRAELKKIQAAEKRRADMMAKFGIKKKTTGQTTGSSGSGGSGDGGGSKPGFKKNDDAWRG